MTHSSASRGRAVFIDRDGTINVEVNYLHRVEDFVLIPGAADAIHMLNDAGYMVVVVTNQAGIARGYYDESALHTLHAHLRTVLAAAGARIDAIYFCPHHPDFTSACNCRKPQPGMLLQAAAEHKLDLSQSWLIGDTLGDIGAGQAAGCRTVLVRTGYGVKAESQLESGNVPRPDAIADDLEAAARLIVSWRTSHSPAGS